MIQKYLTFMLACLLIFTTNLSLVSAQTRTEKDSVRIAKIKDKITQRETGKKKRVTVIKLDGNKLKGYVGQKDEDSFTLVEAKTNQNIVIDYGDVAKVKKRMTKGDKIALGVVIAGAATAAAILLGFLSAYCNNEGC